MYRRHDVWSRVDDDQVVCYRAFEDLSSGEFFVQSKDFFWRSGGDPLTTQVQRSEAQLVDLIGRDVPSRRTYRTIEEAIRAHEKNVERRVTWGAVPAAEPRDEHKQKLEGYGQLRGLRNRYSRHTLRTARKCDECWASFDLSG